MSTSALSELAGLRQRLKQRARWHRPLSARSHHCAQNSFHAPKVDDLRVDLGEMFDGDLMHTAAGPRFLIGQVEQSTYLVKGKTEVACTTDEAKSLGVGWLVEPVTTHTSNRLRQ